METKLINGVDPLPLDAEILALAEQQPSGPFPGVGRHIVILNEQGQVYRTVTFWAPIEASRFVDGCIDLGLRDRVGFSDKLLVQVDSLSGRPLITPYTAILQLGDAAHPLPR